VDDQTGSPTWVVSLGEAVLDLLALRHGGTVHFCNRGAVSWFELARTVLLELGLRAPVTPITSRELARKAARPAFSCLDTGRFGKTAWRWPPHPARAPP